MIRRLSLSVVPPQTPSRSLMASACSKHDKRTGQVSQMAFASSAFSSESGKNTPGSRPLQAPRCLHVISTVDIGIPPRCRGCPHGHIVCVGRHSCPIRSYEQNFPRHTRLASQTSSRLRGKPVRKTRSVASTDLGRRFFGNSIGACDDLHRVHSHASGEFENSHGGEVAVTRHCWARHLIHHVNEPCCKRINMVIVL